MHDFLPFSLPYIIVLMVSSILVISVSTISTVLISLHHARRIRYLATTTNLGGANLATLGPW